MIRRILCFSAIAVFVAAAAQRASAVTITTASLGALSGPVTTSGTLSNQGVALELTFSLSSTAQLTIFTNSYGGGTNVDGTSTAAGGFMPSLVLFDGTGNFVAAETFPSPIGHTDPTTGLDGDAYIKTGTLTAGTYILALSDFLVQQPPTATNLSDGFINYGSGNTFTDVQGNLRNGNYSLNIAGAGAATAPEPASFWLLLPTLAGAAAYFRVRKGRSTISTTKELLEERA